MKNSILLVLIFLGSFCYINGQHYFSTMIPTSSSVNIYQSQLYGSDKLLITYLSSIDSVVGSTIMQYDLNTSSVHFYEFPYYLFATKAPFIINDNFYIYTDDLLRKPAASFFKLDNDFEIINKIEYSVWEEDMGVLV